MLRRYEALLLTVPEITQDEERSVEKGIDQLVSSAKGTIVSFERWGKFKLAYPVEKNDYGVYFLVRFELSADAEVLNEIRSFFAVKLHEIVMRAVISKLDPRRPMEYHRPKSLEEAPAERSVDAFLKKNKMSGLADSDKNQDKYDLEEQLAMGEEVE